MYTGTIGKTVTIAGIQIQATATRSEAGLIGQDVNLPAGLAGTLTTRTSNTEGVLTVASGHGVSGGDKIDIYWEGGLRYGATVDSVTSTTITFGTAGAGAGDNLPAADTALVVAEQVTIDEAFDGDDLQMIVAAATFTAGGSNARAHVAFLDAGGDVLFAVELADGEGWDWTADTGVANPLTGDPVASIKVSAGTAAATRVQLVGLYTSVE